MHDYSSSPYCMVTMQASFMFTLSTAVRTAAGTSHAETCKQTCPHHLRPQVQCFPSADAFFACTNFNVPSEVSFPSCLPFFPATDAHSPRATFFNIMHDIEVKLRCLELDMLIAATFDVEPVIFLQCRIPSTWLGTIPQALQFLAVISFFITFKFILFLPGTFDHFFLHFLTCPSLVG